MPRYITKEQMGIQYTEIEGVYIDDKDYKDDLDNWAHNREKAMRSNIKSMMPYQKRELMGSVIPKLIMKDGYVTNVSFSFYRSGIFQAYGVGKGFIHTKMGIIRGRKSERATKNHTSNGSDFTSYGSGNGTKRKANDWFDTEVESNIQLLADVVVGYYGDKFVLSAAAGTRIIKI